jgi:hypothetical protein
MPAIHPKTWDDGVMPLDELPTSRQLRIAHLVAQDRPPPRWLRGDGFEMESRAWYEWHWARGKKLGRRADPLARPKIPLVLRLAVYERDGYACRQCGTSEALSLDHIHPFSLGGKDTFNNLQTLCCPCNSRKGARV